MSDKVFEEAPQPQQGGAAATDKVRKAARQLAYDTRYKVKQKFKDGQKADPASLKRAYMQQLGSSSAPGPVKALAKKMLIGEEYDVFDIEENIKSSTSDIFAKVFVEGGGQKVEEIEEAADTKYTIRVTDKKTKRTYYRKADRAKISELRGNPNISSVEITGRKESDTYDKTGSKGKKASKDYDGDGKVESGSKEHAGVVHNAIQKKKGGTPDGQDTRNEEFIGEVNTENDNPDANEKRIDIMKGKNTVKVNPSLGESIKAELAALSAQRLEEQEAAKAAAGPTPEEKRQLANKDKMLKRKIMMQKQALQMQKQGKLPLNYNEACEKCDGDHDTKDHDKVVDSREVPTKMNLARNKLRAMGLKMSYDMEGEMTEATYPSDFINPDGSKRAVAKKKTGRPIQHDQPTSGGRRKTVDEEASDTARDERQMRGGMDANKRSAGRKLSNAELGIKPGKTAVQKQMQGKSAVDIVKSQVRAKYGKDSVK